MTKRLGKKEVLRELKQIVRDAPNGEATVVDCVYRDEETQAPVCIVGQFAARHGVLDELCEAETADVQHVLRKLVTLGGMDVLREAQWVQDNGNSDGNKTWGEAVRRAAEL